MALNINRSVDDVFYRYKMPRLVAKVEGKGNGIKTVIVNMSEIAKALSRPPTYPTKYFGCELGAQTQFDNKNERYIVNGEHDASKLQDLLDGFIRKWVLCAGCDNPETNLATRSLGGKKHEIRQSCMACGHSITLDQKHRLATFIIKNPPEKDEKVEMAMKAQARKGKAGAEDDEDGEEETVGMEFDESGSPKEGSGEPSENEDNDDWGEEASNKDELTENMKNLVMDPDADLPLAERLDKFYNFVSDRKKSGKIEGIEAKKVLAEADRLDVDKEKAALLIGRALFSKDVVNEIPKSRGILILFTNGNKKAQKYLIGAVEQLVSGESKGELLPKTPHILKALYDEDICDEEVIIDWAKKASKKFVSKEECKEVQAKAKPFVDWLETADEESESEEEEEDEEESEPVVEAPKKEVNGRAMPNGRAAPAKPAEEDDDDDIDIDDI